MSSGLGSHVQGCQLSNYLFVRGPAFLLCCPLFHIKTCYLGSLAEILQTASYKEVRTTTPETIFIFPLIQLYCIGKMDDISDWLIGFTNRTWGFQVLFIWRLSLFFPFWLYTWVLFSFNAFQYGRSSSEGSTAFQLSRGKQIPQCLWLDNIDLHIVMVFGSRGSLALAHPSHFWAARSRLE